MVKKNLTYKELLYRLTLAEEKVKHMKSLLNKKTDFDLIGTNDEQDRRIHQRMKQLRALAIEMTHAEHKERTRLAGVLHDNLLQLLVTTKWNIKRLYKKEKTKNVRESLSRSIDLLDKSITSSNLLASELSPIILHEFGFIAALKWLGERMYEKEGLTVKVESELKFDPDEDGVCILLFQSIRELLLNVIKHSGVREAFVSLKKLKKDDCIKITVSDKGCGFDPQKVMNDYDLASGFGLVTIRERLNYLNGNFKIDSSKDNGTIVTMILPMSEILKK